MIQGKKKSLLLIVWLSPLITVAQDLCTDQQTDKLKHRIEKAEKKSKLYDLKYAEMAFTVAECYRHKADTSYIIWYKKAADIYRGLFIHLKKKEDKLNSLKNAAYSLYYSGQYADAQHYFVKCLTFCHDQQINLNDYLFYYGDCQLKLKDYNNALKTFMEYKTKKDERHNVDILIKECENKINAQ